MTKQEELKKLIQKKGRKGFEASLTEKEVGLCEKIEEQTKTNIMEKYLDELLPRTPKEVVLEIAGMMGLYDGDELVHESGKGRREFSDEEIQKFIKKVKEV